MKYLIFSDLHGAVDSIEFILDQFDKFNCDQLICLGDILYHGPRNDLPKFYNPKRVIELLNPFADKIIAIQGNCDAEVDQMVLKFPIVSMLDKELNGVLCHLEHGHHLNETPTSAKIIFYGHTHIHKMEAKQGKYYINPGSITIPKENTCRSYMIFEDNCIMLYDMQNNLIEEITI